MLRILIVLAVASSFAFAPACASEPAPAPAAAPLEMANDDQKTLYALGVLLGQRVSSFKLTAAELDLVKAGFADAARSETPKVVMETYGPKVNEFVAARAQAAAGDNRKAGAAFLEKKAAEEGVKKTGTGLLYKVTTEGTGASPTANDTVKVQYRGTLIDGTEFDSSYKRGEPASFPVSGVIAGWTEALQLMKEGSKWQLFVPPNLAYGERGAGRDIGPNATLLFEVELISVK